VFLDFYGLREQPFGVTPDPRYLYKSPAREEAFANIVDGIATGQGFLALVGRPGTGKTTLLFRLIEELKATARTAFLFQTQCDSREFLWYLLTDLGMEPRANDLAQMHHQLNQFLAAEAQAGRRLVLMIDEAQDLDEPVLETVRLLSNFERPGAKLMQIVMAGQPRFAEKLRSPGLLQLRQRISVLCRLDPLSAEEASRYIDHRLHIAGYEGPPLFTPRAQSIIAESSQGIPRNINNLCFNSLTLGCEMKKNPIDTIVVREVVSSLCLESVVSSADRADSIIEAPPAVDRSVERTARPSVSVPVGIRAEQPSRAAQTDQREVSESSIVQVTIPPERPVFGSGLPILIPTASKPRTKKKLLTALPSRRTLWAFGAALLILVVLAAFAAWRFLRPAGDSAGDYSAPETAAHSPQAASANSSASADTALSSQAAKSSTEAERSATPSQSQERVPLGPSSPAPQSEAQRSSPKDPAGAAVSPDTEPVRKPPVATAKSGAPDRASISSKSAALPLDGKNSQEPVPLGPAARPEQSHLSKHSATDAALKAIAPVAGPAPKIPVATAHSGDTKRTPASSEKAVSPLNASKSQEPVPLGPAAGDERSHKSQHSATIAAVATPAPLTGPVPKSPVATANSYDQGRASVSSKKAAAPLTASKSQEPVPLGPYTGAARSQKPQHSITEGTEKTAPPATVAALKTPKVPVITSKAAGYAPASSGQVPSPRSHASTGGTALPESVAHAPARAARPSAVQTAANTPTLPPVETAGAEAPSSANAPTAPAEPQPDQGKLTIDATVPGARIVLDGATQPFLTPHTFLLTPGTHRVSIVKRGYESVGQRLTVGPGEAQSFTALLELPAGVIEVITDPPGLQVFIDDKPLGVSPAHTAIRAGHHTYRVIPPAGRKPAERSFDLQSGVILREQVRW
jgi:general secretion pathway protein A